MNLIYLTKTRILSTQCFGFQRSEESKDHDRSCHQMTITENAFSSPTPNPLPVFARLLKQKREHLVFLKEAAMPLLCSEI